MTTVQWDPKVRDFMRKLPKEVARRIYRKIDKEVILNPQRYLETLAARDEDKIRVGDYRLFVTYDKAADTLFIRAIRHRRNAYKGA